MKKKRSHVGCLFWVALVLLLIVVFLFNRPKIAEVLKSTGLTGLVSKQTSQPKAPTVKRVPNNQVQTQPEVTVKPESGGGSRTSPVSPTVETPKTTQKQAPANPAPAPSPQSSTTKKTSTPPKSSAPPTKTISREFQLYYVKVGAGGKPVVEAVARKVEYVNSPLTKTFDELLSGAGTNGNGVRTLIPAGTKLLSATIRNGTAYLDFNDQFRFNSYGVEGYNAQLAQVVYTATQFQSVKRVQILIAGTVRKFLAPEGIAIDKPLDRSSFQG